MLQVTLGHLNHDMNDTRCINAPDSLEETIGLFRVEPTGAVWRMAA